MTIDFTWNTELSAMSISVDMDRTIYPSEAGEPAFWAPMTLANGKWSMSFTARQSAECQQSDECPQIGPKVPDSTIKSFILQLKVEKDGVTSFPGYTIKDN